MENQVERSIVPFTPAAAAVRNKEKYNVFLPFARAGQSGIAAFNIEQFDIKNKEVSVNARYLSGFIKLTLEGQLAPKVSATDNGKFLRVENGKWVAATIPRAEEAVF